MSTQIHTLVAHLPWETLQDLAFEHFTSTPVLGCAVGARWSALFVPLDFSTRLISAMSEHVPLIEISYFYAPTLTLWHHGEVLTSWSSDREIDVPGSDLHGTSVTRPGERLDPAWQQHFDVTPDPHDLETLLESLGIDQDLVMLDGRDAPEQVLAWSAELEGEGASALCHGPASLYWYDVREATRSPSGIECDLVNTGGPLLAIEVTCWSHARRISPAQVTFRSDRRTFHTTHAMVHIALLAGLKSEPPPSLARHQEEREGALALWSSRRFTLQIATPEPLTKLVLRAYGIDGEPHEHFTIEL